MEEGHLKAIRINKQIGNYDKDYCEICGKEIDIFEDEAKKQDFLMNGKICEECQDNNY